MDRFRNSKERKKTCNEDQMKLMPYAFQRFLSYLFQENGVNGAILSDYEPEFDLIENMDCFGNDLALTRNQLKKLHQPASLVFPCLNIKISETVMPINELLELCITI